ncbi:PREDICTED: histone H1 [Ipomoea nil]|uniref:histone H1 n=1 Tax=Ipomoea nil TaxID=35883 RepID=UPI000901DAC8|nr:PREDICTED: histone H1 [Ipomoea nil]
MIIELCGDVSTEVFVIVAMASIGEVEKPNLEQPAGEAQAAAKPVKEKKVRVPKEKKAKAAKTATHPPYFQMIKEALSALNEKNGSSPYAIAKHMEEKHKGELPANFRKILGLQLKNSAAKGKLIKIKASYKLSEAGKKNKTAAKKPKSSSAAAAPKAVEEAKAAAVKKGGIQKKVTAKRSKKSTPTKPKQPKSIKSPAKKTRKAVAA